MLTRLLTKKVPYTFNRAGYYYFSRRVPADLLSHYSYPRIVQGLKTRSAQTAKSRALVAAAKLDEYWSHFRMADPDLIGCSLLKSGYGSFARSTQLDVSTATEQCKSEKSPENFPRKVFQNAYIAYTSYIGRVLEVDYRLDTVPLHSAGTAVLVNIRKFFLRLFKAKPVPPVPYRLITGIYTTFMKQVFHISQ